ncbi:MAG: protease HtpX, partial [Proteobacteria bacterium]|nr:protease HtpX [Pseudomonadota bacterium]
MKRIVLFLATNLAVLLVLSFFLNVLGVGHFMKQEGLDLTALLAFSAIVGFAGAIISLLMSKPMAKWSTGARIIDGSEGSTEFWLVQTVQRLAERANIGMPDVAVYEGEPNAFATGAFRNSSLVAVSTGLMDSMSREQVEAVLAHEVAHVANGDMVTLALIQGVVNTFVVFISRVVGYFVDRVILKNDRGAGIGFYATVIVCEIVFGILASVIVAWFSRQREFRADAGSAKLLGSSRPMIGALARLGGLAPGALPAAL